MKILKTLAVMAVAVAALATSAFAATDVRLVGSTAYRANVHEAILNYLGSGTTYAYDNTQGVGFSSHAIFQNSAGTIIVKTSWSGSASGVQAVASAINETFFLDSVVTASGTTSGAFVALTVGTNSESVAPDGAMSDVFQSSTPFKTPSLTDAGPVGIVPFVPAASNGAPSGLTNLDSKKSQYLFTSGFAPLAIFTGNNADEGAQVLATGRDTDSGTRLTFVAESGIGLTTTIKQYQPTASSGVLSGAALYAQETINGIVLPTGTGGESSGGTLAKNLRIQSGISINAGNGEGSLPTYFISYLGLNDLVTTALSTQTGGAFSQANHGPAVQLSWNGASINAPSTSVNADGVAFLSDNSPITEGKYTFWAYEHLYYKSTSPVASNILSIATQIAGNGSTITGTAVITTGAMNVSRSGDGANIGATYF